MAKDQFAADEAKSEPPSALVLVSEIFLEAESIRKNASPPSGTHRAGDDDQPTISFVAVLREALLKRSLSDRDLARVWALLLLGANTAKRVHRERHENEWQLKGDSDSETADSAEQGYGLTDFRNTEDFPGFPGTENHVSGS
jgi:hypothetical protein